MKRPRDKGADVRTKSGVYDGKSQSWTGVDHAAPDVLLEAHEDTPLNGTVTAHDFTVRKEVWKTLVRYVWHNARSVAEACIYFGVAALHLEKRFENRMQRGELKAIARRGEINGHKHQRVFLFARKAVYRSFKPLTGYTPLSALLHGEHGEWRDDLDAQDMRRSALLAIIRAAWQDIEPGEKSAGKWEKSLRAAFMNFTALTGEDRDLLAWVTQTEFAVAFDETRAAFCARRKRRVKKTLLLNGCTATTAPGGKSDEAIATYAEVQKGNHNRAGEPVYDETRERQEQELKQAQRSMRADLYDRHTGTMIPIRKDVPRDAKALRAFLKAAADRAEERRLAELCGVDASEISIAKTKPDEHP